MILEPDVKNTVISGDFKSSNFSITVNSKAFQILSSNVYSNKVRAVIREYSTNAVDAHIEAGQTRPFDVVIPSSIDPIFSVRDYGNGINEEDMFTIFSSYFTSTKSSSNEFTGMLGLGSKSLFSLVDSFIVKSFQSGVVKTYSAFKDAENMPSLALLTSEATDEPDGLLVSADIDKSDNYRFFNEAVFVYSFFDKLPNMRDDIREAIEDKRQNLICKDNLFLGTHEFRGFYLVMGNVPYEVHLGGLHGYYVIPIGSVSFDPGREKLSMDKKTTEFLESVKAEIIAKILPWFQSLVNEEPTVFKKSKRALSLKQYYSHYSSPDAIRKFNTKRYFKGYKKQIHCDEKFNTDCTTTFYRDTDDKKIRSYLRNSSCGSVYIADDPDIDDEFISDVPKVVWQKKTSYKPIKVRSFNGCSFVEDTVDMSEEYVYVKVLRGNPTDYTIDDIETFTKLFPDTKVYGITGLKKLGEGIELSEVVKKSFPKYTFCAEFSCSWLTQIDDFFTYTDESDKRSLFFKCGVNIEVDHTMQELQEEYFKKYPMLNFVSWPDSDEVKIIKEYINAVH